MVKRDGQWHEVDWEQAFDVAGAAAARASFGVLASPHSTLEELFLVSKLDVPGGFPPAPERLLADGKRAGIPWLGMPIAELGKLDRVLVVGSFLRKDHPLIAHRLRQAAKRGAQIHMLHSVDDDWLMPIASRKIVRAVGNCSGAVASFKEILAGGKNAAVFLGNFAQQHPQAAQIHAAAQALGRQGRLPRRGGELGRRLPRRPAAAGGDVRRVLEAEEPPAAQRRARARLRRPARGAAGAQGRRVRGRA